MDGCGITIRSVYEADAGHFRRRECMSTRFDLWNLIMQARKCNRFDGGRLYETSLAIDKLSGNLRAHEQYDLLVSDLAGHRHTDAADVIYSP